MLQHFHDWFLNMRDDEEELDYLSRDFISQIGLSRMIDDPAPKKITIIHKKSHQKLLMACNNTVITKNNQV